MTSPQARRAVLEQALHGLLSISKDTEEALQQARLLMESFKDEDSDSDEEHNWNQARSEEGKTKNQQLHQAVEKISLDEPHIEMNTPQTYQEDASQEENLEITRPPLTPLTQPCGDNHIEEDMSIASENEEEEEGICAFYSPVAHPFIQEGSGVREEREAREVKVAQTNHEDLPLRIEDSTPPLQGQERPAGMLYEVRVVSVLKNEVPLFTKLNPALQVEVVRLHNSLEQGPLFWVIQVECAEHQTKWELATFVDEASSNLCKRSRTEFSDTLLIPADLNGFNRVIKWMENLPDVQLRAEREVWDHRAKACHTHRHRFQFKVGLVDAIRNPVSQIAFSSLFRLASCCATLDDSIADQVLKARKIVKHMGDDEIRDRTSSTSLFVDEEREHVVPQVLGIDPKEITLTGLEAEFSRVEINGKNFRQACVLRSDSNPPDEIQRACFPPTSRIAGAFIKIPKTSELMMLRVRNFDDPNLVSAQYEFLTFKASALPLSSCPLNLPNFTSDIFADLSFFELPGEFGCPSPATNKEEKMPMQEIKNELVDLTPPPVSAGIDRFLLYHHIVSGFTHTVATTLQGIEFKKLIKMKLGMVPALLALLSENPCTFILCLVIHAVEQQEINESEFKKFLEYVSDPQRDFPLQPSMLFDFLQNEIGIDVRARFKKMARLLTESMVSDAESMIDDESSDYSPEDAENYSTSDEDYEDEPPAKILRSSNSTGSRLRLSVKLEKPIPYPSKNKNRKEGEKIDEEAKISDECDWEGCLLCDREMPVMLQTQNPTWAAIMRVVFYSFIYIFPAQEYWMVRQAYKYIEDHWEKLCPGKDRTVAWRKQLQDALSHNKQYFISGMDKFGQKGYWGLKQIIDPWAISDQDDHPKRAYHHQPRRGRPPKSSSVTRTQVSRRESNSYIYKCLNHPQTTTATLPLPPPPMLYTHM